MSKFTKEKQHYSLPSNTVSVKPPIKEIKLILYWRDGFSETHKGFDNVQQLADFLKNNQELATAIGYIPNAKKQ